MSAVVLMTVQTGLVNQVAEQLCGIPGVGEVFSVVGRFDLVALLRIRDETLLARIVNECIRELPGVTATETLVASGVYERALLGAGCDPSAEL